MRLIMMTSLLAISLVGCFEGGTTKNVKAEGGAAESEDLKSDEIESCLDKGGSVSKKEGKIVCDATGNKGGYCWATEVEEGIQIQCGKKDPLLVKHGGCTAELVADGVSLQCGEDTEPLLIRHGSSCLVEEAEGGVNISCPGSEAVFVADGADGVDGTDCSVTSTESGAIIKCGADGEEVAINHGESAGIHTSEVIDPCGDFDGFDEVLLRMSDGTIVAYFEDGNSNRFLTVLDPAEDAGNYITTDKQRCPFTLHDDGQVTW